MSIPLVAVHGEEPGPTLAITAGIHGDEYEGPEGLRRFLHSVDPTELRGCILAVLQANPLAFESFNRIGDADYLDLNRSFPGNERGFLTQRLAHLLVSEIVERADVLVDLHSVGLAYDLFPYVGFNSTPGDLGERSFQLAKSVGIEYLCGSTPFPNVMRLEAAKRNIPAILVEVGGSARLQPTLIPIVEDGLRNVARHLGLLDREPNTRRSFQIIMAPATGEFLHAPTGGFLVTELGLGDSIQIGRLLGTLRDPFGEVLMEIRSEVEGVLISYRTLPVTRLGDWTYSALLHVAQVSRDTPLHSVEGL